MSARSATLVDVTGVEMSKHSVWDRDDCHPAWMINNLLRAESVPCPFEFSGYGKCGAQPGERCRITDGTYVAPNGRTIRFMPAHMSRYGLADKVLGRTDHVPQDDRVCTCGHLQLVHENDHSWCWVMHCECQAFDQTERG